MSSPVGITELGQILAACQSPDNSVRNDAETKLRHAEENNSVQLYSALSEELVAQQNDPTVRQLAALKLKNAFWGKSRASDERARTVFSNLDASVRSKIKEAALQVLLSPGDARARKASAQVMSAICRIELPQNQWVDAVEKICQLSKDASNAENRGIAFVALGYIAEEANTVYHCDSMLSDAVLHGVINAVVSAMAGGEAEAGVTVLAVKALYWLIPLMDAVMEDKDRRDYVFRAVAENCQKEKTAEIKAAGMECLAQLAGFFYSFLIDYMPVLGPLSWEAIETGDERLAIPALEFWSTICDIELTLVEDPNQTPAGVLDESSTTADASGCFHIVRRAVPYLAPLLCRSLTRHEVDDDDDVVDYDQWNQAKAAGCCLGLVARVTGDTILNVVLTFVNESFQKVSGESQGDPRRNWKDLEAALMAYGSVMDGPSSTKLAPLVDNSFQHVAQTIVHPVTAVRDTSAWALGQVAKFHPQIINKFLTDLVPELTRRVKSDALTVSGHIAWLFLTVGEGLRPKGNASTSAPPPTTLLSAHFTTIVQALLEAAQRPANGEGESQVMAFRASCYLAVGAIVKFSARDCKYISALMAELIRQLEASCEEGALQVQVQQSGDLDLELQSQICGALQTCCHRLKRGRDHGLGVSQQVAEESDQVSLAAFKEHGERLWAALMKLFQVYQKVRQSDSAVHEGALFAASALVTALEENSPDEWVRDYTMVLRTAIAGSPSTNQTAANEGLEEVSQTGEKTCSVAAGLVSDLANSLGPRMATGGSDSPATVLMTVLVQRLNDPATEQRLKPAMFAPLGDIALAIHGNAFAAYLPKTMEVLLIGAQTKLEHGPVDSADWLLFVYEIRCAILEALVGIVWGLHEDKRTQMLKEYLKGIFEFCALVASPAEQPNPGKADSIDYDVLDEAKRANSANIDLVCDLVEIFGKELVSHLASNERWVSYLWKHMDSGMCLKESKNRVTALRNSVSSLNRGS